MNERRYYVYADFKRNGQMFYVGKGTRDRFKTAYRDNEKWLSIVKREKGFTRKILYSGLTEKEAYAVEIKLIAENRKILVNKSPGGGRNSKTTNEEEKVVVSFRVTEEHYDEIKKKLREMLVKRFGYKLNRIS